MQLNRLAGGDFHSLDIVLVHRFCQKGKLLLRYAAARQAQTQHIARFPALSVGTEPAGNSLVSLSVDFSRRECACLFRKARNFSAKCFFQVLIVLHSKLLLVDKIKSSVFRCTVNRTNCAGFASLFHASGIVSRAENGCSDAHQVCPF